MLKRKFDRLLSSGQGMQLLWLLVAIIISYLCFWGYAALMYEDWNLTWQDMVSLYIGTDALEAAGEHNVFKLLVVLVGIFLFSALLVSVFTNIFDNVSESVRKGERRYRLSGHTLILGNSPRIVAMVRQLLTEDKDATVAIMTISDVGALRETLEAEIMDRKLLRRVVFYFGRRDNRLSLKSACAAQSKAVYILGERNEQAHDSLNLKCYELVCELAAEESNKEVHCFLTLENESSMSVIEYEKTADDAGGHLVLEVVNENEYDAERLLVHTDFLPCITMEQDRHLHMVIFGTTEMARAFSFVTSHICHYPNFRTKGIRTDISFVGVGMKNFMEGMVALKPGMFELSHYEYVDGNGTVTHYEPDSRYGDFLDIRWQFIDALPSSQLVRGLLHQWNADSSCLMRVAACQDAQQDRIDSVLNLPYELYESERVLSCVYIEEGGEIVKHAVRSGMYDDIKCFGNLAEEDTDPLFVRRRQGGMMINHIYDKAFGNIRRDACAAWKPLIPAHKLSSIESANSIRLRQRNFESYEGSDLTPVNEVEHRRWMATVLLMGYRACPADKIASARAEGRFKELKARFIHLDIVPYDSLPAEEKNKDELIIVETMEFFNHFKATSEAY